MFNNIASTYDRLNHILSFGIDIYWRWRTIRLLKPYQPKLLLDMATGTTDFALTAAKHLNAHIIGIDLSESMLKVGQEKLQKKNKTEIIHLMCGDAENIPVPDNVFDAVTVGFGVRNFENLPSGLAEMCRTLKVGGRLFILEFSKPKHFPFRQIYFFYFKRILPFVGKLISKDKEAYTYLPESVHKFPEPEHLKDILLASGFSSVTYQPLTFGIVHIHHAVK